MEFSNKVVMEYESSSILEPMLFILYINDMKRYLFKNYVNMYTDETIFSVSRSNYKAIVEVVNRELHILELVVSLYVGGSPLWFLLHQFSPFFALKATV